MSRSPPPPSGLPTRFPRVSGDEPYKIFARPEDGVFSPRERG